MSEPDDDPQLNPMDQKILNVMKDGKRQTPKNLSMILDGDAAYISGRTRSLVRRGYLNDPGQAERSGMVEPTPAGLVAAHRTDKHLRTHARTFRELCTRVATSQSSADESEFDAQRIELTNLEERIAREVWNVNGVVIASQIASKDDFPETSTEDAADALYALYFFGLADRNEGMDAYTLSDQGYEYFGLDPGHPELRDQPANEQ